MKDPVKGNFKKIAINGDGQLAMFIAASAKKNNFECNFWSKNKNISPCRNLGTIIETQSWSDLNSFQKLIYGCEYLVLENEFIPPNYLKFAQNIGIKCFPNHSSYSKLNSKVKQFELVQKYDIKIPNFKIANVSKELPALLLNDKKLKILKKIVNGYDGLGNLVIKSSCTLESLSTFLIGQNEIIIQDFLEFDEELAFMCLVDNQHNAHFFPTVSTIQKNNVCHFVLAPIKNDDQIIVLQNKLTHLFKDLNAIGIFGVELFKKNGQYYFNEFSPRPHNSAHYTIDACNKSQFDCIIDLIKNKEWENISMKSNLSLMVNLLGNSYNPYGKLKWKSNFPSTINSGNFYTHLYNKNESRIGRKMGHITLLGNSEQILKTNGEWIKENYEI